MPEPIRSCTSKIFEPWRHTGKATLPTAGSAEVYPQEITRVFLNLISNAFYAANKRAAEAGGEPRLKAATRNLGEKVEIRFRDNGMGIAAESLPHLFDAGWQMRRARAEGVRTGGVWLGLAVAHQIVELHGGRIVAASGGASMGAVFTVRLPFAPATHANTLAPGVAKLPASAKGEGRIDAR